VRQPPSAGQGQPGRRPHITANSRPVRFSRAATTTYGKRSIRPGVNPRPVRFAPRFLTGIRRPETFLGALGDGDMARWRGTHRPIDAAGTAGCAGLKRGRARLGVLSREQIVACLLGTILLGWLAASAPAPEGARMRLARGD